MQKLTRSCEGEIVRILKVSWREARPYWMTRRGKNWISYPRFAPQTQRSNTKLT